MTDIVQDQISFSTYVERQVVADTVKVSVQVTYTLKGEEDAQSNVRETILTALKAIIDGEWTFARLDRSADRTGYEVVEVLAQLRVKESEVNGITRRAKESSKPGLQLSVSDVDYNPTRQAVESTRAAVRQELMKYIQEEVKKYNDMFGNAEHRNRTTEGVWRVGSVQFNENYNQPQHFSKGRNAPMMAVASTYSVESADSMDSGLELTQKVGLNAAVVLIRVAAVVKD